MPLCSAAVLLSSTRAVDAVNAVNIPARAKVQRYVECAGETGTPNGAVKINAVTQSGVPSLRRPTLLCRSCCLFCSTSETSRLAVFDRPVSSSIFWSAAR